MRMSPSPVEPQAPTALSAYEPEPITGLRGEGWGRESQMSADASGKESRMRSPISHSPVDLIPGSIATCACSDLSKANNHVLKINIIRFTERVGLYDSVQPHRTV